MFAKPLGIMGWASGPHIVWWCVVPVGFASGRGGGILRLVIPFGQGILPLV